MRSSAERRLHGSAAKRCSITPRCRRLPPQSPGLRRVTICRCGQLSLITLCGHASDLAAALPDRVPAHRRRFHPRAPDHRGRRPFRDFGHGADLFRPGGIPHRAADPRLLQARPDADFGPKHPGHRERRGFQPSAVSVLSTHAQRQGLARHGGQSHRRPPGRHQALDHGRGLIPPGLSAGRDLRDPDRADRDALLRFRAFSSA